MEKGGSLRPLCCPQADGAVAGLLSLTLPIGPASIHCPLKLLPEQSRKKCDAGFYVLRKVGIKMHWFREPLAEEKPGVVVLWFWGHTACVALGLSYTSMVFSVCCPSGFCTMKSHKSVSPGQELVGFSSKMPTASQWTKKNSPICPICFSSCTFTSSTSTKSGGTFHPLSPYPCHRTSARAGPSDPEYTHACSISCPNKSSDWSGICLAYHCIPITSTDHAVGA